MYFVASDGNPCNVGSPALIEANKIPVRQEIQVGRLSEIKRSGNPVYASETKPQSRKNLSNVI